MKHEAGGRILDIKDEALSYLLLLASYFTIFGVEQ
jgi:hypothetical protein